MFPYQTADPVARERSASPFPDVSQLLFLLPSEGFSLPDLSDPLFCLPQYPSLVSFHHVAILNIFVSSPI